MNKVCLDIQVESANKWKAKKYFSLTASSGISKYVGRRIKYRMLKTTENTRKNRGKINVRSNSTENKS